MFQFFVLFSLAGPFCIWAGEFDCNTEVKSNKEHHFFQRLLALTLWSDSLCNQSHLRIAANFQNTYLCCFRAEICKLLPPKIGCFVPRTPIRFRYVLNTDRCHFLGKNKKIRRRTLDLYPHKSFPVSAEFLTWTDKTSVSSSSLSSNWLFLNEVIPWFSAMHLYILQQSFFSVVTPKQSDSVCLAQQKWNWFLGCIETIFAYLPNQLTKFHLIENSEPSI